MASTEVLARTQNDSGANSLTTLTQNASVFYPEKPDNGGVGGKDFADLKFLPRVRVAPREERASSNKSGKKEIYRVFDAVPFTPSQGVRTPSPNNMATRRWAMYSPFANGFPPPPQPESPRTVLRNSGQQELATAGSDTSSGPNSAGLFCSSPLAQPQYLPFMVYPSAAPLPMVVQPSSPCKSAFEQGAMSSPPFDYAYSSGTYAGSPLASMSHSSPFGPAAYAPFSDSVLGMDGLPYTYYNAMPSYNSPLHSYLPQYQGLPLVPDYNFAQQYAHLQDMEPSLPGMAQMRRQMSSPASGGHLHGAHSLQTVQIPHMSPNQARGIPSYGASFSRLGHSQSADLDKMTLYGLQGPGVHSPMLVPGDPAGPQSILMRDRTVRYKSRKNCEPKIGPDGQPRLNARQRRTLRRAKERALKGLLDMSQALLQKADLPMPPEFQQINAELASAHMGYDSDSGSPTSSTSPPQSSPGQVPPEGLGTLCPEECGHGAKGKVTPEEVAAVEQMAREAAAAAVADAASASGEVADGSSVKVGTDVLDITAMISQLILKGSGDGGVDDKLIRDLQIIQSLIGALKNPLPEVQLGDASAPGHVAKTDSSSSYHHRSPQQNRGPSF